jgi:mannose/cellobiose epimerase-like protein (N-acyl-D-glucosamine 2-epimerase family)
LTARPDFRSREFLREHLLSIMAFYDGRCTDPSGGFYHFYKDDGRVYDSTTRHLVSSARFVYNHAAAACRFPDHPRGAAWRAAAEHGLRFLRDVHRDPASGGYAWLLHWDGQRAQVLDATNHAYGLAFVLLAHAHALMAGVAAARAGLDETAALIDARFRDGAAGLYADEASPDWHLSPYRGQNANMHACEAMLAAFVATGEVRFLDRACAIAEAVTVGLAEQAQRLVWEHYRVGSGGRWVADWDYHRDRPGDLFRPWGFQTGHLAEWAKLLLQIERQRPDSHTGLDRVGRAARLFAAATTHGWDKAHGGLVYGFAGSAADAPAEPPYEVCNGDKYFWVQAETIAAAARLALRTADAAYWTWYERVWAYAWAHFVDHRDGAWYRILGPDNRRLDDEKSPAGKTDYHTMGACHDVLDAIADGAAASHAAAC